MTNFYSDTIKLFEQVVKNLSGISATVRWQQPVCDTAGGEAYKSEDGRAIVDLNPGAPDRLFTLCHEAAHLRQMFNSMAACDFWQRTSGSMNKWEIKTKSIVESSPSQEADADMLANVWKSYAIENAWRYPEYPENVFASQLRCLAEYPKFKQEE
jgi:hypothetical protein